MKHKHITPGMRVFIRKVPGKPECEVWEVVRQAEDARHWVVKNVKTGAHSVRSSQCFRID